MTIEIKLPDLGEGIDSGTVTALIANEGDKLEAEDAVIELETDKAVVPVPAGIGGVISSINVSEGDEIKPGDVLAIIDKDSQSDVAKSVSASADFSKREREQKNKSSSFIKQTETKVDPSSDHNISANVITSAKNIAAGPATRKLAREIGINLNQVPGTARGGRITLDDLKLFAKAKITDNKDRTSLLSGLKSLPNFSKFGETSREKISRLRSTISERMSANWANIPHVHQFQDVDITHIVSLQKKYAPDFKNKDSALSITQFLIKGLSLALKEFPQFNASFDHTTGELIYKKYYHIGVAVDTPAGLIVPVLKNVDHLSIFDIGKKLKELATKTRERKVETEDLQGASITLSNLGGIGGGHFTPIINHPEVAILGVGKSSIKPTYLDGEFVPRTIIPLCLAYDHRVIDGADGARFIVFLTDYLENIEYHMMLT